MKVKYAVFTTLPSLKKASHYNRKGYRIIFRLNKIITKDLLDYYLELGKYYSEEDIQTAVLVGTKLEDGSMFASYLTYNQVIKGEKVHAEQILAEARYKYNMFVHTADYWYMDLEPCYDCLYAMAVLNNAKYITYLSDHKEKWNTEKYLDLVKRLETSKLVEYRKE